jgi:glyoxylase-like metal-dependent hydrolase (beta-lactamase superfamily II)
MDGFLILNRTKVRKMRKEIKVISLSLPFHLGRVNCYLIETDAGHVLIDTGGSNSREELGWELASAGCKPGLLKLIVLTHGDFDHIGNAAYLRNAFGCKIAMHYDDLGMVERGDMFVNRKKPNIFIRLILPIFSGFGRPERFVPDLLVEDEYNLSEYGLDARVISIPGHSKGSIGIVTAGADLFCGDLLENTDRPVLNPLTDDLAAANASIQKLESMRIGTVYPGHGKPFPMNLITTGSS